MGTIAQVPLAVVEDVANDAVGSAPSIEADVADAQAEITPNPTRAAPTRAPDRPRVPVRSLTNDRENLTKQGRL
jgi:hypothetical protein